MKKVLLPFIAMIFWSSSFSQDSKFSIELNYPLPADDNFIGQNFNGIIDVGLKYRFAQFDFMDIGVAFNAGLYKNSKSDRVQLFDVTTYIYSPKVFAEFKIKALPQLHPSVGIGYSIVNARSKELPNNSFNPSLSVSQNLDGINLNLGIAYDLTSKLFAQVQYDFIKVGVNSGVPDITYNTNINIVKFGLGYRL